MRILTFLLLTIVPMLSYGDNSQQLQLVGASVQYAIGTKTLVTDVINRCASVAPETKALGEEALSKWDGTNGQYAIAADKVVRLLAKDSKAYLSLSLQILDQATKTSIKFINETVSKANDKSSSCRQLYTQFERSDLATHKEYGTLLKSMVENYGGKQ